MDAQDEKLTKFVRAVDGEVDSRIEALLGEAEAKKKELIENANKLSLEEAYSRVQDEVKRIHSKYRKLVSKAELDAKKSILVHREELIDKLFDDIRLELLEFASGDGYGDYLCGLLDGEKDGAVVMLCRRDMKFADMLTKKFGVKCEEDLSIKIGGLCLAYPERGIVIDKTLDQALSDERDEFNSTDGALLRL